VEHLTATALAALLSPDGAALLAALPPYDANRAMARSARLRDEGVDPELVAAALTQSRLRAKARAKLGDFADAMLLTPAGLEQATRLLVGVLHARRYLAAGVTKVADLTCGIGADALAFAGVGLQVLAADINEVTAAIAAYNLRAFPEAQVRHADGLTLDLAAAGVDGVYADPARRTRGGQRVFDPRAYQPPLDAVLALRATVPALGIKVGPGIAHRGLPDDAEVQWLSVDGEVVEAGLWFGPLTAHGPGRGALVIDTRGGELRSRAMHDDGVAAAAAAGPPGGYLYEPDGAVIRAGLVAHVASELRGRLLDPTIAYITTDSPAPAPAPHEAPITTGYRVLDVMAFNVKRLKAYLRERRVGRVQIKKRGTAVTPEALRAQLSLAGDAEATIVLTRIAGTHSVLIVEPLGP
jgi:hypothetical protein